MERSRLKRVFPIACFLAILGLLLWLPAGSASSKNHLETQGLFVAKQNGIADMFAKVEPSVVYISTATTALQDDEGKGGSLILGSGSGVICAKEGYILTNYHVIADAEAITVHLSDGRTTEASVAGVAKESDLAVLKIDLPDLSPATLGDSDMLRVGDLVFPIGNPGGEQFTRSMTMGIVSGLNRQIILEDGCLSSLIQTDAAINPGNSGGPLVNANGEVVGINSIKIVDAKFEGMGFAVPINTVVDVLGEICPEAF